MDHHPARKKFSQNFLQDPFAIGQIINAINPQADDIMIEIGPGPGALTEVLLEQMKHLTIIEKDPHYIAYWQNHPKKSRITLIDQDVLKVDFSALYKDLMPKGASSKLRLVGNLPYHISSSASKKKGGGVILDLSHELDILLFLFQKVNVLASINKKVSNLNINTDDLLLVFGKILSSKPFGIYHIKQNYFASIPKREILIIGDNFKIYSNLLDDCIEYTMNNKIQNFRFNKNSLENTYYEQHRALIKNNFSNLCTYNEGMNVMKLIKNIKDMNI